MVSLDLLASILRLPSPKKDIDGSDVHSVYWKENDLVRIAKYCRSDVHTLANVFLKFSGEKEIDAQDIIDRE